MSSQPMSATTSTTPVYPTVPPPADAGPNTVFWFARFNAKALERGLSIAASKPSVPELRADAVRAKAAGDAQWADYCNHIADMIETDVRLLGLNAIVGDYNVHADRVVCRMYAADFRKALFAQRAAASAAQIREQVRARNLQRGDVVGSGEKVLAVEVGLRTPRGKVEVTLAKGDRRRTSMWGASAVIGVTRAQSDAAMAAE